MEQRKQAIAAWVSWSNANPHLLDAERQRKLDQALRALEEPAQQEANEKEWGAQFDQWLDGILKEENPT